MDTCEHSNSISWSGELVSVSMCVCVLYIYFVCVWTYSGGLHEELVVISVISHHFLWQASRWRAAVVWFVPLQHEPDEEQIIWSEFKNKDQTTVGVLSILAGSKTKDLSCGGASQRVHRCLSLDGFSWLKSLWLLNSSLSGPLGPLWPWDDFIRTSKSDTVSKSSSSCRTDSEHTTHVLHHIPNPVLSSS